MASSPQIAIPQPVLTATINSYLYKQYQDDDDLLAFVASYNAATQTYVDWFASVNLPFYPALTGSLLDWVAIGLYGLERTTLTQTTAGAIGPLNTAELDTITLNSFTPPTTTYYAITDDIFKRILTWNLYKGDGKRFCMKWLKRRIMRFLVGTDGLDPNPLSPDFVVGPENTQAISTTVAVSYLSAPVQSALATTTTGGALPASTTYYYVVTALNAFGETTRSNEESVTTGATTTNRNTVTWAAVTNASSYRVYRGTSAGAEGAYFTVTGATTFVDTGTAGTTGAPPSVNTAYAESLLTVTINGAYISSLVQLQPNILSIFQAAFLGGVLDLPVQYRYAVNLVTTLTATASPPTESTIGIATTLSTGTASVSTLGGDGVYTLAWTWESGGVGIGIDSASAADTSFTATGMTRGTTLTGVAKCTVTDSASHTAYAYVTVTIQNISAPSVALAPTTLSVTGVSASETTGSTSASITGGAAPYTYNFTWQTGGAGLVINASTASATSITAPSLSPGATLTGTLLCTIHDAYGQAATATCAVSVSRASLVTASVSPTSVAVSSSTTPLTTANTTITASGGQTPYTYAWTFAWTSHTDGATETIGSPTSATTHFTASGMSAGNTDTGTAKCVVTDAYGQTANVSVGVSFTYLPPLLRTFTSATTDTVPAGYTTAAVEGWAPGGGGGGGDGTLGDAGGGGGAGGYFRSQFSVTGGQTFTINEIGSGGTAGPSGNPGGNGTSPTKVTAPSSAVMVANPGSGGPPYPTASGGAGGTATGGNQANTTGGSGGGAGSAGVPANGVYFNNPATYGKGGTGALKNVGSVGASGVVSIRYS